MWAALSQDEVTGVVAAALEGGVTWFDTAEAYGFGQSERALSTALAELGVAPGDVVVATKWLPFFRTARLHGRRWVRPHILGRARRRPLSQQPGAKRENEENGSGN